MPDSNDRTLSPVAKKALAEIIKMLEGEGFTGEITIVVN
jgi:hypothetical protein